MLAGELYLTLGDDHPLRGESRIDQKPVSPAAASLVQIGNAVIHESTMRGPEMKECPHGRNCPEPGVGRFGLHPGTAILHFAATVWRSAIRDEALAAQLAANTHAASVI
jgi:hypothetical protein